MTPQPATLPCPCVENASLGGNTSNAGISAQSVLTTICPLTPMAGWNLTGLGARRRAPWLYRSPVEQTRGAGRYAAPGPA